MSATGARAEVMKPPIFYFCAPLVIKPSTETSTSTSPFVRSW
jgi:hypothetical protein